MPVDVRVDNQKYEKVMIEKSPESKLVHYLKKCNGKKLKERKNEIEISKKERQAIWRHQLLRQNLGVLKGQTLKEKVSVAIFLFFFKFLYFFESFSRLPSISFVSTDRYSV